MQDAARIADFKPRLRDQAIYAATASVSVVARFLGRCWSAYQARRERARVRAILYGMPDRELKDLGFTRSEIESVMVDDSGQRIRAYPKQTPLRR